MKQSRLPFGALFHLKRLPSDVLNGKLGFIACMDSPLSLYLPVATLEQAGNS